MIIVAEQHHLILGLAVSLPIIILYCTYTHNNNINNNIKNTPCYCFVVARKES